MQPWLLCVRIVLRFLLHTDVLQKLFDNTLHREEVALSVKSESKLHALVRKLCQRQCLGQINVAHLI